jgi:long-chain fatty acid transport protein
LIFFDAETNLMERSSKWRLFLIAGFALAIGSIARGGGIEVPMQDSKAAGEADAFTAQADDPAAIFYNPAGLTQLQGTQISAGAYYLQPEFHFQNDSGGGENMSLPSVLPHVYAESDLGTEKLRVGIGVNDVFGINEDWGSTGPLSPLVNNAQLMVINIAPTIAYKILDNLSVGVAANIYYGNLYLTRSVELAPPPTPEGEFHYRADAWSGGATPSILWKINEENQVGAYYRSPFSLKFSGNAQVTLDAIPEAGPSNTTANLELPQSIGAGYSWHRNALTLEGDIIWTDWHSLKDLSFQSSNPAFNGQSIPANWESGFTFRAGTQYRLDKNWALRCGYAYSQTSVPESTFSPLVPDSNYHLIAAGVGYTKNWWGVDMAFDYIFREKRHIINDSDPLVDGTWDNTMYGLMLTFTARL